MMTWDPFVFRLDIEAVGCNYLNPHFPANSVHLSRLGVCKLITLEYLPKFMCPSTSLLLCRNIYL